jgi:RecB family exonuclease
VRHLELAFGNGDRPQGRCDPASTPEPVTAPTPAGPVRLRGRIDRVDLVGDGDGARVMVIDYKTGRAPSKKQATDGRNHQLAAYILAAEELLRRGALGGAFHSLGQGNTVEVRRPDDPDKADDVAKAVAALGEAVARLRAGVFTPTPAGTCPSYCPMRRVCHFSPARVRAKLCDAEGGP